MNKFIIVVILMLFTSVSMAQSSTAATVKSAMSNLTPEQQASILLQVTQTAAANKPALSTVAGAAKSLTITDIDQYSKIGLAVARAIGVAANEVGVAVNVFLASPAGMITAGLIVYEIIGQDIISLTACVVMMIVWLGAWRKLNSMLAGDIYEEVLIAGFWKRKVLKGSENPVGIEGYLCCQFLALVVGAVILGFLLP